MRHISKEADKSWCTSSDFQKFQRIYYCPHHSCNKVMFLHVSVILSTGGVWQTPPWPDTPPGQTPPPPGRHGQTPLGRHPPGQTPWEEPLGRHLPPPPSTVTATAADGTHSTRMHSCSQLLSDFKEFWRNFTLRLRNIIFSGFASFCHNFPVDTPNNLLFSREGRNTDVAKPACWWWV